MSDGIKRMLAERQQLEAQNLGQAKADAFELRDSEHLPLQGEALARLFFYLDEDWEPGKGWRPSSMLVIGYSALKTLPAPAGGFAPYKERKAKARQFWNAAVEEARQRWVQGFFADPFANPPRPRSW